MRRIHKTEPLPAFQQYAARNPTKKWEDFHDEAKQVYQDARFQILTVEQDCLCGYTELPIENEHDSHLDHFVKQDFAPNRRFDWSNLIASCNNESFGGKYKDNKHKIKLSEYSYIFNPVEDEVQTYFYYNELGEIEAKDSLKDAAIRAKVDKTITVFNLKHPSLVARRSRIIQMIQEYAIGGLDIDDIKNCLAPQGFKSVVEQYCNDLLQYE